MNTLTYKGYSARIDFDARDNSLVGRLLGIQDIIGFHAGIVADLHTAFEEAVDDYLEACKKLVNHLKNRLAVSCCSGFRRNFMPQPQIKAQAVGKSLNQLAIAALSRELHTEWPTPAVFPAMQPYPAKHPRHDPPPLRECFRRVTRQLWRPAFLSRRPEKTGRAYGAVSRR